MSCALRSLAIGFAELLEAGGDGNLSAPQSDDVAQIHSSARTLLQLIDGILELSRIDAGMVTVAKEQFDIVEAIQEVRMSLEPSSNAKARRWMLRSSRRRCRSSAIRFGFGKS